jgi:hypothetical protein
MTRNWRFISLLVGAAALLVALAIFSARTQTQSENSLALPVGSATTIASESDQQSLPDSSIQAPGAVSGERARDGSRKTLQRKSLSSSAQTLRPTITKLISSGEAGDFESVMALARQLTRENPSQEEVGEAMYWLNPVVVSGSTDAAMLQGELCITGCYPADANDPGDYRNWTMAATYYFLAYLMGDERALRRLQAITPHERSAMDVYNALGVARMMLEGITAARSQRGLGPLKLDLNATSPYLKPNPLPGNQFLLPSPPPGG